MMLIDGRRDGHHRQRLIALRFPPSLQLIADARLVPHRMLARDMRDPALELSARAWTRRGIRLRGGSRFRPAQSTGRNYQIFSWPRRIRNVATSIRRLPGARLPQHLAYLLLARAWSATVGGLPLPSLIVFRVKRATGNAAAALFRPGGLLENAKLDATALVIRRPRNSRLPNFRRSAMKRLVHWSWRYCPFSQR